MPSPLFTNSGIYLILTISPSLERRFSRLLRPLLLLYIGDVAETDWKAVMGKELMPDNLRRFQKLRRSQT